MKLDRLDSEIIRILKEDARVSNVEVAKRLGISEANIRKRIAGLRETGIITKFTIETEEERKKLNALTFVSVTQGIPTEEVADRIKKLKGVKKVFELAGDIDICAIVDGNSIEEVNDAVDSIRHIPQVAKTDTKIILKVWE